MLVRAEAHLVDLAADYDAKTHRHLGRHLLEVIAPKIGEAHAAALLEAEERDAIRSARLTLTDDGTGKTQGRFTLPTLHAAMLKKALQALMWTQEAAAWTRPTPERMGQAFTDLLERITDADLPTAGGTGATVVVTMTLEALTGGLADAALDTGDRISAATARRLACEAGIIPAVLGGAGQVLDLGRTRRFHTRSQRIAIAQRDRTCTPIGCDAPPAMCHVHHDHPWSRGGPTNTTTGRPLCPKHHRMVHDPTTTVRLRT